MDTCKKRQNTLQRFESEGARQAHYITLDIEHGAVKKMRIQDVVSILVSLDCHRRVDQEGFSSMGESKFLSCQGQLRNRFGVMQQILTSFNAKSELGMTVNRHMGFRAAGKKDQK